MQPVYVATTRIEMEPREFEHLAFSRRGFLRLCDGFEITSRATKILTSETLALQTIRNSGLSHGGNFPLPAAHRSRSHRQPGESEAPAGTRRVLSSLSVKRVPNSRLMDVSFESTDPQLAPGSSTRISPHISSKISAAVMKLRLALPPGSLTSSAN